MSQIQTLLQQYKDLLKERDGSSETIEAKRARLKPAVDKAWADLKNLKAKNVKFDSSRYNSKGSTFKVTGIKGNVTIDIAEHYAGWRNEGVMTIGSTFSFEVNHETFGAAIERFGNIRYSINEQDEWAKTKSVSYDQAIRDMATVAIAVADLRNQLLTSNEAKLIIAAEEEYNAQMKDDTALTKSKDFRKQLITIQDQLKAALKDAILTYARKGVTFKPMSLTELETARQTYSGIASLISDDALKYKDSASVPGYEKLKGGTRVLPLVWNKVDNCSIQVEKLKLLKINSKSVGIEVAEPTTQTEIDQLLQAPGTWVRTEYSGKYSDYPKPTAKRKLNSLSTENRIINLLLLYCGGSIPGINAILNDIELITKN